MPLREMKAVSLGCSFVHVDVSLMINFMDLFTAAVIQLLHLVKVM